MGGGVADPAPFLSLIENWPIVWNPPGWGSVTDVKLQEDFGALLGGEWKDALLIGMKPGAMIPLHSDPPDHPESTRVHIVLATNDRCWSYHDGAWQQLAVGGHYCMDPASEHAAVNFGSTIRYHLVVDAMDPVIPVSGTGNNRLLRSIQSWLS